MTNDKKNNDNYFGEVIYAYTREQAIEDGVLVDVSEMAKEAGIKFPVAVTIGLWEKYIKPAPKLENLGQSIDGRLWDTLFMFAMSARRTEGSLLLYKVIFTMPGGYEGVFQDTAQLKGMIGPGDNGEPVITIMLPNED